VKTLYTFAITLLFISCQKSDKEAIQTIDKQVYAEKVKQEFLHAWNGYKTYAWGNDDLKPLSKSFHNWYEESLLMTPVDAFSTMKLMELDKEAAETKALIFEKLSFDKDLSVQVFEINIRLLGGLLSAYQLDGDQRFLDLAIDLADRLMPAFKSQTGLPYRFVHLQTGEVSDPDNNPAEIGTLMLEFGTLSKHTGDMKYYDIAKKAIKTVYDKRSDLDLVGTIINVERGEWTNSESTISARIDSYYEYLLKAWLMFGDEDFKTMWETSINAVNTYLADDVNNELWYGYADMHEGKRTKTYYGALDAFFPAVLALGGDLDRAKRLQASNFKMWKLSDIEPEVLDYSKHEIVSEGYVLRPENLESSYYLYTYTNDEMYLHMSKFMFESIVKHCRTEVGYAHLKSVTTKEKRDAMQSFFLAETLKYAYLIFADPKTVDFKTTLFNTEAHPLKIWNEK
jgi:mannosidase alpha-like ER degradation enhancer 2